MKTLLFVLFFSPFMQTTEVGPPVNLATITKAISAGDADALSTHFDSTVEIAILDEEDMYSKAEATTKVKSFFSTAKPTAYSQVHKGKSKGKDSQYCIGNLSTADGEYRVYIYLKVKGAETLIQEMRFDEN